MGEMVEFATDGGTSSGYLATPESPNGKALIVVQEWWGLQPEILQIADRYAEAGYHALVPDLWGGEVTDQPDEAQNKLMAMNIEQAEKDLVGAVDLVAEKAGAEKVGSTGYCIGGALSIYAAALNPKVAAVSSFYYVFPHKRPDFTKVKVPVLVHFGTNDEFMSMDDINGLIAEMEAAGVDLRVEIYEGAGHAFCNTANRLGTYDEKFAELAWSRNLEFFDANL